MINFKLQLIDLDQVDFSDRLFQISTSVSDELEASIRLVGLTSLPILQQMSVRRFRIVSGFRRLVALRNIGHNDFQALIASQDLSPLKLFEIAIYDNMSVRPLNPIEISTILNKLEYRFNLTDNEIVERYLPKLGLGKNAKILALYIPLAILEQPIQEAVANDQIALQIASQLALASADERSLFLELVQQLHLGKNKQKDYWRLLRDLSMIEKCSITNILSRPQAQKIIKDQQLSPSQRGESLKHFLYQMRYPRYSRTEDKYHELIKEMRLPPDLSFKPTPFFEGDRFTVQFSFRTRSEYHQMVRRLQELGQNGYPEKLSQLAESAE